ncbi:N-acetylmuramoyl-L-alanine amidase [Leuconostoc palmae]|uniref:N-acetylmuramoyl-L-alanine amidase n=1 Tax=Leuconostoc palmae TaxID=501487 RepID=UPI001C7D5FD0|nr:N-acetylmuramoyl-L-alanine amidase [Leuconostoc palmae]
MIKKWLLSNIVGVSLALFILSTVSISLYALTNREVITTRPSNVQLRTGPDVSYKSISTMKSGTSLIITERSHGWYKVRRTDNEQTGWVASWVAESHTLREATSMSESTIVIDPGHGGDPNKKYNGLSGDNGSSSADGKYHEKTYTLRTGRAIRQSLEKTGARVFMIRDSDVLVPLLKIPEVATKYHADAQISIHFDHADDENSATTATGVSQFYYHQNSKDLAYALHNSLNQLPISNRGVDTAEYVVLNKATCPAALLELGYINNPSDFKYIRSTSYQQKIAKDVTTGLATYFKQISNAK